MCDRVFKTIIIGLTESIKTIQPENVPYTQSTNKLYKREFYFPISTVMSYTISSSPFAHVLAKTTIKIVVQV